MRLATLIPAIFAVIIAVIPAHAAEETVSITVTAEAETVEQARDIAFRDAVSRVVGAVIASNSHVQDSEVAKHEIINYSSGYVYQYQLVNAVPTLDGVSATFDIQVRSSRLADRLLGSSSGAGVVNGNQASQQIATFQYQGQQGQRILDSVLADYPQRAFSITLGNSQIILNRQNTPHLLVPITLQWDQNYTNSLAEAVQRIADRTKCGNWFVGCQSYSRVHVGNRSGYFNSNAVYEKMHLSMFYKRSPRLMLSITDGFQSLISSCYNLPELDNQSWASWRFAESGTNTVVINSEAIKQFELHIPLTEHPVEQFKNLTVQVIPNNQCP